VGSAMKVKNAALTRLPIDTPNYDRHSVSVGIAHIGAGHFHRAHQAMYIDRLLQRGMAREWGICGIGVMPGDWTMRDVLRDQGGLYTLILENPDGTRDAHMIGSIIDYRYAPDDPEPALEVLAAATTRIISLTITEGGYRDPDGPAFALITEALARRRRRGIAAPTIVSCDNIEHNGEVARRAVVELQLLARQRLRRHLCESTADEDRPLLGRAPGRGGRAARRAPRRAPCGLPPAPCGRGLPC